MPRKEDHGAQLLADPTADDGLAKPIPLPPATRGSSTVISVIAVCGTVILGYFIGKAVVGEEYAPVANVGTGILVGVLCWLGVCKWFIRST